MTGTFYLNNSGSRRVVLTNGKKSTITLLTKSGKQVVRTVNYYASFGNFDYANISYKGKRIDVLADQILED